MSATVKRPGESVNRTPLSDLIREGSASAIKIKRATRDALLEWLAQSKRLNIARTHHKLRGRRFTDFAGRIGIDRSSAYQLVKLWDYKDKILSRCEREGRYPGWETALYWFERAPRSHQRRTAATTHELQRAKERIAALEHRLKQKAKPPPIPNGGYWLTPPDLRDRAAAELGGVDLFDPCPFPRPADFDGLTMDWGWYNLVNPPFNHFGLGGRGLMAFGRKAITEMWKGKTSYFLCPSYGIINLLLEAGAEPHSLGRVGWLHTSTGLAASPNHCTAFILRGRKS